MTVTVLRGDALDVLRDMPDQSVDAVVTDPPYGLEFMGKEWDAPWASGTGIGEHNAGFSPGAPSVPGVRGAIKSLPSYTGSTNPTCRNCGGTRNGNDRASRRSCRCERPTFPNTTLPRMLAFQHWCEQWAAECLRVLKPGGHMLAFGGTRTWHRLTCAVEDAGFEIRDSIDWLYGSGFPKSLNVGVALMKAAGLEPTEDEWTPEALEYKGFGTALKPAHEPIVVARKPLAGTVAANVLKHGTGALNIDGTRVAAGEALVRPPVRRNSNDVLGKGLGVGVQTEPDGRWPSNLVLTHAPRCGRHLTTPGGDTCQACNDPAPFDRPCQVRCVDGCPVRELDEQSGTRTSGILSPANNVQASTNNSMSGPNQANRVKGVFGGDSGGASRFFPVFRYQAKAPTRERVKVNGVAHPTVKPVALMQWLVRLVTPPGGVVLDPFAGSGTTAEAAHLEGFDSILIENHDTYFPLIAARLERCGAIADSPHPDEEETA